MARNSRMRSSPVSFNALNTARTAVLGLSRLLFLSLSAAAAPLRTNAHDDGDDPDAGDTPVWVLYTASVVLVLLGGAFAGLTIALMGQDSIYLQVLAKDETDPQQKNAARVYNLLQKGKHWVLVTLLLSNVIVNETLPVVLDRCLGGGVAAVVGSTFLIVIFGEVLPQSVCVRYGLPIGGYMSKPVLALMWLLGPVAWPTAKLLDWVLGEDHGTVYKKSGLKTLVTLHRSLGEVSERLNQDEVTIISAVLDLKEKPVVDVMTPMEDVFTMSEDTVLDEKMMDMILSAGYSRIPIHEPGNPTNFVGMLLVKILITYDPEDGKRVRDFPLATLPETRPETSCLDIVNFFQEGKSHMVLVSEYPGEDHGALGVVTLEDVIEELIGEEIIDESDVYIDVHKAIRRLQPAPKARLQRRHSIASDGATTSAAAAAAVAAEDTTAKLVDDHGANGHDIQHPRMNSVGGRSDTPVILSTSPKTATFLMRRSSAGIDGHTIRSMVPVRASVEEMKQHLRHLGPSNPATNPKNTRSTTVKVKPGLGAPAVSTGTPQARAGSFQSGHIEQVPEENEDGNETTHLLRPNFRGKDGIQALRQMYGATTPATPGAATAGTTAAEAEPRHDEPGTTITLEIGSPAATGDHAMQTSTKPETVEISASEALLGRWTGSDSTGSIHSEHSNPTPRRSYVRSGSITENVVETRGIRKVVLETASSSDDDGTVQATASTTSMPSRHHRGSPTTEQHHGSRSSGASANAQVSDVEEEGDGRDSENEAGGGGGRAGGSGGGGGGGGGGHHSRTAAAGAAAAGGAAPHHGGGGGGGGGGKKRNRRRKRRGSKS